MVTSFASAPASPLYYSATEAHDGAFFVVVAVWHLEHLLAVIKSSAGPASIPRKSQSGGGKCRQQQLHVGSSVNLSVS